MSAFVPKNFPTGRLPDSWQYSGDVNLVYGGLFLKLNLDDWNNGYLDAVRVDDLASGCGFDGAVLVERITVLRRNGKDGKRALDCCGQLHRAKEWTKRTRAQLIAWFAECLVAYGHYDPADDYDGNSFTFQLERDQPTKFDGWQAERKTERQFERFVYELLR
jgi:hypothetical protein